MNVGLHSFVHNILWFILWFKKYGPVGWVQA